MRRCAFAEWGRMIDSNWVDTNELILRFIEKEGLTKVGTHLF